MKPSFFKPCLCLLIAIFTLSTTWGCDDTLFPEGLQKLQISSDIPVSDPIAISSAMANGCCLYIEAGYSCGCKEHEFELYWNGSWNKTNPPSVNLNFYHNSNGELCEAYCLQKFMFSIEAVKYQGADKIILNLSGYNKPITYVVQ